MRNSLIRIASKKANKSGLDNLISKIEGSTALIFTNENPFKIYNRIVSIRSSTCAKPGAISPAEIIIEAQETNMPAGPALSDLKAIGLKTKIENGKIVITEDKVVTKPGEAVKPEVANVLLKLGLEPFEIRLDVTAMFEKGMMFFKDVLEIRPETTLANIQGAYMKALTLSCFAKIFNSSSIKLLISDAHQHAQSLAVFACIPTSESVKYLLSKAFAQAKAVEAKSGFSGGSQGAGSQAN